MAMKARDIMRSDFVSVDTDTSAVDTALKLVADRRGFAIVVEQGRPVGIVTEWDFLEKLVSVRADGSGIPVSKLMSSPLVGCDKDTPTEEVVDMMVKRGIRRIVVTDGEKVVGVITSRDVLRIFKKYVDEVSAAIARFATVPF